VAGIRRHSLRAERLLDERIGSIDPENNLGTNAPKHKGKRGVGPTRKQDESTR
jgi:hypothetical protein